MSALPFLGSPRGRSGTVHRGYLAASLGVYVLLLMVLVASSGFLPYVTDNNESFSAALQARNMLRYGFADAMGLADEATANPGDAHPYVYTHGGNFPRLPAYALMRLSVTPIEWQIALLSLIVGWTTIYLCFKFFSRTGDDLLAFLVCSVLSTDYVLFMEWEANAYRVWQGLLFFAGLVCVQHISGGGRRTARAAGFLLFLTASAIGYFEIVFAVFAALTWVLYAAFTYWRRFRLVLRVALNISAGMAAALGGLFAQSVALFGWTVALQDIRLTFLSRNFYKQSLAQVDTQRALRFFHQHHIVFWIDNPDTRGYLHLDTFLRTVGTTVLQIYTPYFILLVWILTMAWFVRMGWRVRIVPARSGSGSPSMARTLRRRMESVLAQMTDAGTFVGVAVLLYVVVSLASNDPSRLAVASYGGLPGFPIRLFAPPNTAGIAAMLFLLGAVYRRAVWTFTRHVMLRRQMGFLCIDARQALNAAAPVARTVRISARELFMVVLLLALITGYEMNHWQFFNTDFAPLWLWAIEGFFALPLLEAGLVGFVVLALFLVLRGGQRMLRSHHDAIFVAVLRYLAAGWLAFAIVYLVFPGYLRGGYLVRQAPLPVFVVDVWVALFFYALVNVVLASGRDAGILGRVSTGVAHHARQRERLGTPSFVFVLSVCLLAFGSAYWARAQAVYVETLPPTTVLGLREELKRPMYEGATFISNNYPGLITYYTHTWAYPDPTFNDAVVTLRQGVLTELIGGQYIWEADRDSNSVYLHPQYYLCLTMPSMYMARDMAGLPPDRRLSNCRSDPIVVDATQGVGPFFNVLVAEDPGRRGLWAIVRLDPASWLTPRNQ